MGKTVVFSEEQMTEFRAMLNNGDRKSDIAKHFGVSCDVITRMCKEFNLNERTMICKLCGKPFKSLKSNRTICNDIHYRKCSVCGKEFVVRYDNLNVVTCSPACTGKRMQASGKAKLRSAKTRETWLSKYGVDNIAKVEDIQEKQRATCLAKYGVPYPMQVPEFAKRNLSAHWDKPESERQEIIDRQRATMQEKYGGYPFEHSSSLHDQYVETMIERHTNLYTGQCKELRQRVSKINQNFNDRLLELGLSTEFEYYIHHKAFDIRISSTNILLEIDPTYTHNTIDNYWHTPITSTYHVEKSEIAREAGFRCIHIFDWDDWDKVIDLVRPSTRIYARNCHLKEVSKSEADKFTDENHFQGKCNGQIQNYGLYYNSELMEVMTFGKPRYNTHYDWELLRLCTKRGYRVTGGASKLFKAFVSSNSGSIISYCNLSKFNGDVYSRMGMTLKYVSPPAKIWSKDKRYVTDNLLRQRGYDQLFKTDYGKGTSNDELMLQNGWLPVYDCGQAVYEYVINT